MDAMIEQGCCEIASLAGAMRWAAAWRSKTPGIESGDGFLVRRVSSEIRIAVVDGAGSGPEAARARALCLTCLSEIDAANLETMFDHVHHACLQSRGAALALVLLDPHRGSLTWAAVGDVEALLVREEQTSKSRTEAIIQRGGTLGYRLPSIISQRHDIAAGDTLIMASDGIRHGFRERASLHKAADELADDILTTYGRHNDDALVLVAKFDGPT